MIHSRDPEQDATGSQTLPTSILLPLETLKGCFQVDVIFKASTSSSRFSITSMSRFRLSMNEFTATRSILLVVARYSVRNTLPSVAPSSSPFGPVTENVRFTRGDNSLSTCRARSATEASLGVGKGTSTVLHILFSSHMQGNASGYNLQHARELVRPSIRHGYNPRVAAGRERG
jgi:hypothetical protein